jgi:anti-sigma-K factor RskA
VVPRSQVPRYRPGLVGGAVALVLVLAVVLVGLSAGGTRTPAVSAHPAYSAYIGSGEVIVDPGHGELVVRHLTPLSRKRTYEVWLERAGGKPQPTRVLFNVSAGGYGDVTVPESLNGISRILVTNEPANGSAHPTTPAVFGVKLS